MKRALVLGAGGFIGGNLIMRLKREGFWVRGVDIKFHERAETEADDFALGDLREQSFCRAVIDQGFDEVYQLAADMGGAGYSFSGEHDNRLIAEKLGWSPSTRLVDRLRVTYRWIGNQVCANGQRGGLV